MDALLELNAILYRWINRLKLLRALHWAIRGLAAGLGVCLAFALVAAAQNRLVLAEYLVWICLGAAAAALAAGLTGAIWPVLRLPAARFFDRRFGLRERVSTALELQGEPQPEGSLPALQRQDALQAARQVDLPRQLPFQPNRLELGLVAVLAAGVLLGLVWAQPHFLLVQQHRLVKQAIAAETQRLEDLIQKIEQNKELLPEQRQTLTQPLRETTQKLQEAQTAEQALAALDQAATRLEPLGAENAQTDLGALQTAGENLGQDIAGSPQGSESALQGLAESLARGDLEQAVQDLKNLEIREADPEQAQEDARQLEQLAQDLQQTQPQLSASLQDLARALRSGDTQAAAQALQQSAQEMGQTAQDSAQAQQAAQAAAQLQASQGQLLQGQGQSPAAGSNAQAGQGASGGNNPSQGADQGASSQPLPGQAGGGAGRGEGGADSGSSGEAGVSPIQQGNGPGDGGETPYESIYTPQRLGGNDSDSIALPGSEQPGGQVLGQGEAGPNQAGPVTVPYVEVLPAYSDAARQAVENGQVPAQFRDLIRSYFSSLEP